MPEKKSNSNPNPFIPFVITYFKIILIINIIVFFSVAYFLLLRPLYIQFKTAPELEKGLLEDKLLVRRQQLLKLQDYRKRLQVFSESEQQKLAAFLPQGKKIPELFVQLEALAKESNLHLDSIVITETESKQVVGKAGSVTTVEGQEEPGGTEEEGGGRKLSKTKGNSVNVLDIDIQLSGGHYVDLKNFLKQVERNLRLFDVLSINFAGEGKTFLIAMRTYYLGEE